jgi:acetyl-CoA carboxylase carboxyl transferase subunit alpha
MKMTARDIEALGVIDAIIGEPLGGAHRHQAQTVEAAGKWIRQTLGELRSLPLETLLEARYGKYRGIGQYIG